MRRGEPRGRVLRHVLARTAALLVMGVLMVNAEQGVAGPLSKPAWTLVTTLGVYLLWGTPESGLGRVPRTWLRAAGATLLVLAALAYRSPEGALGLIHLRPHWWGILGLIGWAYLTVSALYVAIGDRPAALGGLVSLLYCVALADAAGGLGALVPRPLLGAMLGTHAAITLSGALLGVLLRQHLRSGTGSARPLVAQAVALVTSLAVAGILLHTMSGVHAAFRISKVHATAPWGLLCAALTALAWLGFFLAADVLGLRRWPRSFAIAGENPLVAYLLAPAIAAVFALVAPLFGGTDPYQALGATTGLGLVRSAVFAWAVVRLTGLLRAGGLRIQL
jgi:hypothetical protein